MARSLGIAKRLREIMRWRKWTAREFAREAGLREQTHVSQLIRRLEAGRSANCDTLSALAAAGGVSLDWLVDGRGAPEGAINVELPDDPLYPSRALAVTAARLWRFHDRVIESVLAVDTFAADPGLEYWVQLLLLESRRPTERASARPPRPVR